MRLYSYVVHHDEGIAPNPDGGLCTLCLCKYREDPESRSNIVEMAEEGDWVIGTSGMNKQKSIGHHGKLIYAMKVDEKLTREEYYRRFRKTRVDAKRPDFSEQCALVSQHFYYFGANAIDIPKVILRTVKLEKKGPGYRCDFDQADIDTVVRWLKGQKKRGKCGEPCAPRSSEKPKGKCKSSC